MKTKNLLSIILLIITSFSMTNCSNSTPTTSSAIEPINIMVNKPEPIESIGRKEPIPLPNCIGNSTLRHDLQNTETIDQTTVIGTKAVIEGGVGFPLSEVVKAELKASVEANYQQTYKIATQRLDTIQMAALPFTHIVYVIDWIKQDYSSTVTFENKNNIGVLYQVPYTYTLIVPRLNETEGYSKPCPTNNTEVPPTSPPLPKYLYISRTIVEPSSVAPGEKATIYVSVFDENGQTVEGAKILLESGGGKFLETETTSYDPNERLMGPFSSAGYTRLDGFYTAWWVCNPCAPGYGISITITKDGYVGTSGDLTITIK